MRPLLMAFIFLIGATSSSTQTPEILRHFDYDKNAALDVKEARVERRGDIEIHDIAFASPKGGRVPAYLVVPKGKGPFAAVVWGHWYWENSPMRNRNEFLDEAVALARSGIVSLLTDGPIARAGHVENRDPLNDQQAIDLVQQIVDMRRGLDVLVAWKEVDPNRIAYVGHSYNASVGAFLGGIERRFKAFVLMAGNLSDEVDMKSKEYEEYRQQVGPERYDAFAAKYNWLDPGKYVSKAAPAVVLMQFGTQEKFITAERARQYAAVVSEPKRIKLYDAPHALNAEARRDRLAFLSEQLKVKPLSAPLIASIPDLFQPPEPN